MKLTVRWWHWIIVTVLAIVTVALVVAFTMRQNGLEAWRAYEAQATASGALIRSEEWFAQQPTYDEALHERWWRESEAYGSSGASWSDLGGYLDLADVVLGDPESLDPMFARHLQSEAATYQRLRELIREPDLHISLAPYVVIDSGGDPEAFDAHAARFTSLLTLRDLACALTFELHFGADSDLAARDLTALIHRIGQPESLLDAMIAVSVAAIRDEAMLLAVVTGQRGAAIDEWIAEPPTELEWIARGFDVERVLFLGDFVARTVDGRPPSPPASSGAVGSMQGMANGVVNWALMPGDGAAALEHMLALSNRWRGRRATAPPPFVPGWHPVIGIGVPSLLVCGQTAFEAETDHRRLRLAARLIVDADGFTIPADAAALTARYPGVLDGGSTMVGLAYERLGEQRFRISLDPGASVPDFADVSRIHIGNQHGQPAAGDRWRSDRNSIEIDLAPQVPTADDASVEPGRRTQRSP